MSVSLIDGHIDDDAPRMTDKEIIKALEYCIADENNCKNCPYMQINHCTIVRSKDVLDLINRQKAEIERLRDECGNQSTYWSKHYESIFETAKDVIKAEAIKEFAERLKATDGYNNHTFDDCASILVPEEYRKGRDEKSKEIWDTIDNLVKEMVGDTDDSR